MDMRKKRGISPIIATVLLVAIVIVVILIIFLWTKGFLTESIEKQGRSAEQACSEIKLEVSCGLGSAQLINIGNIDVYQLDLRKKDSSGNSEIQHSDEGVIIGGSKEIALLDSNGDPENCPETMEVIPLIIGSSTDGENVAYTCVNNVFS